MILIFLYLSFFSLSSLLLYSSHFITHFLFSPNPFLSSFHSPYSVDEIHYYDCREVFDHLKTTEGEEKNILGQYNSTILRVHSDAFSFVSTLSLLFFFKTILLSSSLLIFSFPLSYCITPLLCFLLSLPSFISHQLPFVS